MSSDKIQHEDDQGRDRTPPAREHDVSVWARAHGVSADELSGDTEASQPATPEDKARQHREEEPQARDKD